MGGQGFRYTDTRSSLTNKLTNAYLYVHLSCVLVNVLIRAGFMSLPNFVVFHNFSGLSS